ncbi:MAG: aminotransferase class III-fold pyridoxal phosphate-dependent enzyme [Candidatus Azambacteria bacterium]|nr:aminotransferase class III-fold pyridoxal phosphate-dependent enzyme [Candidatus Azambacteria bacterium]
MGPKSKELRARFEESVLVSTHDNCSPVIVAGNGIYVWDVDGNKYVDMNSQVGISSIGQRNPTVMKDIRDYYAEPKTVEDGNITACIGSDYIHPMMIKLAEELKRITPGNFPKKVGFKAGGGEAVDSSVKFLKKVRPERPFFVSFVGAFHGRVGSALQLTCSKYAQKDGYERSGYFIKAPYNTDFNYLRGLIGCEFRGDQINAIFLEFVQGEGGIVPAHPTWIAKLVEFCNYHDIRIVDDEIQAGLGRTGKMWACEHYGVVPDILVTSKALGFGSAISAFVVNAEMINDNIVKGWDSETFYAPPDACVKALSTIKVIEKENLVSNAYKMGEILGQRLHNAAFHRSRYYKIRGLGLMWGLEFTDQFCQETRDLFVANALKEGLLFMGAGRGIPAKNPTVRFMPPLCITESELNAVMDKVEKILSQI